MSFFTVSRSSIPAKSDRGGKMQVLLSPKTVAAKTGFMGTLVLSPDEAYKNHYHPYSDEYVYVIDGEITVTGDTDATVVQAGTAVFIPKDAPHRLHNSGLVDTTVVFFSCPLAPQPDLGHKMLED